MYPPRLLVDRRCNGAVPTKSQPGRDGLDERQVLQIQPQVPEENLKDLLSPGSHCLQQNHAKRPQTSPNYHPPTKLPAQTPTLQARQRASQPASQLGKPVDTIPIILIVIIIIIYIYIYTSLSLYILSLSLYIYISFILLSFLSLSFITAELLCV